MSTHARDVLAFYEKFGIPHRSSPGMIDKKDLNYKLDHVAEELRRSLAEDRTWTSRQLAAALADRGIHLGPREVRRHLK